MMESEIGCRVTQFGDFYIYENPTEKVENMTIAINPDNQTVYLLVENLKEGALNIEH